MRKQFVKTTEKLMEQDGRLVLLLGDISTYGFRNAFAKYPLRAYNIGICEQAMTSIAAGLSKEGLIPVLHSIAPFVVERCYEQLKIDLCYQNLAANIVSVGSSYDYAALGSTHHCPGDVAILRALPGMEIVIPGTPAEFDHLFLSSYNNDHSTYYRLSERSNENSVSVEFGEANVIQRGSLATVIAVGPTLSWVLQATNDLDVNILYYTTVSPFDRITLRENCHNDKIILVEPYYSGTLSHDIQEAIAHPVKIHYIGVPHEFLTYYGNANQHDEAIGFTTNNIRLRLIELLKT